MICCAYELLFHWFLDNFPKDALVTEKWLHETSQIMTIVNLASGRSVVRTTCLASW